MTNLPLYPYLTDLTQILEHKGLLLLSAEPGSGKTTLLPWKLLTEPGFRNHKILLLEPRRLAARAAAHRIASLLGEPAGQTVGLRTRYETLISAQTRLEVVTEGVLTRLIQADPALTGYGTVLFDEFHTRSLQGDLGLALTWEVRKLFRPDLKLALLSATLPKEEIRKVFGDLPLIEVPGRVHPVGVIYRPPVSTREKPWEAAARLSLEALGALKISDSGTILCFLPGWREMIRARELLAERLPDMRDKILLLHGQMAPEQQNEILDPELAKGRRVVLATNIAETSLTIPGVKAVVDIGLERRVRFSPRTGMDHWETVPVSLASAEQRKGRAGRSGPGICYRWWQEKEYRDPFSPPEISEADLAPLALETAFWGAASPCDLPWLTPPPQAALKQALVLLAELGLLADNGKITPAGREAVNVSIHPRLAKMVLDARSENLAGTAAVMSALLETEDLLAGNDPDFRDRITAFGNWAKGHDPKKKYPRPRGQGILIRKEERHDDSASSPHQAAGYSHTCIINSGLAKRVWEETCRILRKLGRKTSSPSGLDIVPEAAGHLLLSAYPDRAAKKTRLDDGVTSRWLLANGRGAMLKGALSQSEFLAIAGLDGGDVDARIFLAVPISLQDLMAGKAGRPRDVWILEWHGWKPKAKRQIKLGAIILKEINGGLPLPDLLRVEALSRLKGKGLAELPWSDKAKSLLARCRFVEKWGQQPDWPAFAGDILLAKAETWLVSFGHWEGGPVWDEQAVFSALENYLGWKHRKQLDALAPESLTLPSGSGKKLDYGAGEIPVLSARLQEFFGCTTTPKVSGQPLLLDLLSPAGRSVQLTRDLEGFWDRAYPEVKKELMGRYPRHYWPDNPRAAKATARAKPKDFRKTAHKKS